jgi:hypothetical protein
MLLDSDSIFETDYKNYRIVTLKYKALLNTGKNEISNSKIPGTK